MTQTTTPSAPKIVNKKIEASEPVEGGVKVRVWVRTDSFGRDRLSRRGVVSVEDYDGCGSRDLRATVVRVGAYWSDPANGKSGYNVLVEVVIPDALDGRRLYVGN